jgi:hypothetical protein
MLKFELFSCYRDKIKRTYKHNPISYGKRRNKPQEGKEEAKEEIASTSKDGPQGLSFDF